MCLQCCDCWLGGRKDKKLSGGVLAWLSVDLERGAGLNTAQLMPMSLTASCFSKIQMVLLLPFWYRLTHAGSPGQRAVKRVYVCRS